MQREEIIEPESTRTAVERKGMGSSLSVEEGMGRSDIKICNLNMRVEKHWDRCALGSCGVAVAGSQKSDKHLPEIGLLTLPQALCLCSRLLSTLTAMVTLTASSA